MKLIIDQDANHSLQFNPGRRGKRLRDFFLSKEKKKILINLVFDNRKVYSVDEVLQSGFLGKEWSNSNCSAS